MKGHSIDFYENSLYVFGLSDFKGVPSFFKYNLILQLWSRIDLPNDTLIDKFNHKSAVYLNQLFIFFGKSKDSDSGSFVMVYSFIADHWEKQEVESLNFRFGSSTILIDNYFYFFSGVTLDSIENSIISVDLNSLPIILKLISPNRCIPPARKNHIAHIVNNDLLIFGGLNGENTYLNDLWKFSLKKFEWTQIFSFGYVPKPRELMGSLKFLELCFIVFGGRDESTTFSDAVFYYASLNAWLKYDSDFLYSRPR